MVPPPAPGGALRRRRGHPRHGGGRWASLLSHPVPRSGPSAALRHGATTASGDVRLGRRHGGATGRWRCGAPWPSHRRQSPVVAPLP